MSSANHVWPSRDDYQNAVLHPERNLKDPRLHSTKVETKLQMGALKLPSPRSGNFGAVYKFSNQRQSYALKVFDKAQPDRHLRYQLIDEHLDGQPKSLNLVSFGYEEQGILVSGRWYPALLMDWAEGQLLDDYLDETLKRRGQVDNRALCQAWVDLMLSLAQRYIAHGDLQHGNILIMPDGTFKLVDYDGMFVPAMRQHDLTAAEIGMPAYQHPKRDRSYFDERLDNFAALVVFLSLASVDRDRWQHYHTDDNCLIVREPDLRHSQQSALLIDLSQSPDAPVRKLAVLLKAAAQGGLDAIPAFAQVVADGTIKQLLISSWQPTPPKRNREEQKARPEPTPSWAAQEARNDLLRQLKKKPAETTAKRKKQPVQPKAPERQPALTLLQDQILAFLAQRDGDEQIARALAIQPKVVSEHIAKLQQQVGVNTRFDLMMWAIGQGFGRTSQQPALPPVRPPQPSPSDPQPIQSVEPPPAVAPPQTGQGWVIWAVIILIVILAVYYSNRENSSSTPQPTPQRWEPPPPSDEPQGLPPAPPLGANAPVNNEIEMGEPSSLDNEPPEEPPPPSDEPQGLPPAPPPGANAPVNNEIEMGEPSSLDNEPPEEPPPPSDEPQGLPPAPPLGANAP